MESNRMSEKHCWRELQFLFRVTLSLLRVFSFWRLGLEGEREQQDKMVIGKGMWNLLSPLWLDLALLVTCSLAAVPTITVKTGNRRLTSTILASILKTATSAGSTFLVLSPLMTNQSLADSILIFCSLGVRLVTVAAQVRSLSLSSLTSISSFVKNGYFLASQRRQQALNLKESLTDMGKYYLMKGMMVQVQFGFWLVGGGEDEEGWQALHRSLGLQVSWLLDSQEDRIMVFLSFGLAVWVVL